AGGDVPHVLRVQKPALKAFLEQVVDRLPVAPRRLHPDPCDGETREPVGQGKQAPGRRREGPRLLLPLPADARHAHRRGDTVFVHIESGAALDQTMHRSSLAIADDGVAWRSLISKNLGFALAAAVS